MYDQPRIISYNFNAVNMATGSTKYVKVPRGASSARVLDISANVTVAFTQVTTPGEVQVGITGDLDLLATLSMGDAAAGAAYGSADSNHFNAVWNKAEDDVEFLAITFVAPTGGTPAGTADFTISIGWDHIHTAV